MTEFEEAFPSTTPSIRTFHVTKGIGFRFFSISRNKRGIKERKKRDLKAAQVQKKRSLLKHPMNEVPRTPTKPVVSPAITPGMTAPIRNSGLDSQHLPMLPMPPLASSPTSEDEDDTSMVIQNLAWQSAVQQANLGARTNRSESKEAKNDSKIEAKEPAEIDSQALAREISAHHLSALDHKQDGAPSGSPLIGVLGPPFSPQTDAPVLDQRNHLVRWNAIRRNAGPSPVQAFESPFLQPELADTKAPDSGLHLASASTDPAPASDIEDGEEWDSTSTDDEVAISPPSAGSKVKPVPAIVDIKYEAEHRKYISLADSISLLSTKCGSLACRICQTAVSAHTGYYQCANHPVGEHIEPEMDIDVRTLGRVAGMALDRLRRLADSPIMCIPCLGRWLSERAQSGQEISVCPFVRDEDVSANSLLCQSVPSDALLGALAHQIPELHFANVPGSASDEMRLTYRPTRSPGTRTPLHSSSMGVKVAILRQMMDAWTAVRRNDPAIGTSLQRRFGIRCDSCSQISVLDRALFVGNAIPLAVRCLHCTIWLCTGCERSVPVEPPEEFRPIPAPSFDRWRPAADSKDRRERSPPHEHEGERHQRFEGKRGRSRSPARRKKRSHSSERGRTRDHPRKRSRSRSRDREHPREDKWDRDRRREQDRERERHSERHSERERDRERNRDRDGDNDRKRSRSRDRERSTHSTAGAVIQISWDGKSSRPRVATTDSAETSLEQTITERWWNPHRSHRSIRHDTVPAFDIRLLGPLGEWVNINKISNWTQEEINYRAAYLRTIIERSRTKCPRCATPVTKNDACAHVRCVLCGCLFCYCCGGTLYPTLVEYNVALIRPDLHGEMAALHLPVPGRSTAVTYFNSKDTSVENLRQYSVDLHHLAFNRSLSYRSPIAPPVRPNVNAPSVAPPIPVPVVITPIQNPIVEPTNPPDPAATLPMPPASSIKPTIFEITELVPGITSCPNVLSRLPEYAQVLGHIELLSLIPAASEDEDRKWAKSEFCLVSKLDRFTGQFEVAKAVIALRHTRVHLGSPLFNDSVDRLRHLLNRRRREPDAVYSPSAFDLALMRAALSYFPVS
jgi:hypothetical protein